MRENTFILKYDSGMIKEYEKEIFTSGECPFFLPMAFVKEGERDKVIYNYSGCIPFSKVEQWGTVEVLCYLENAIELLVISADYLIKPEKININCNTLYKDMFSETLKIAYIPCKNEITIMQQLKNLIEEIKEMCITKELYAYLLKMENCLLQNPSLKDVIKQIGLLKREAYLCGIN